MTCRAAIAVFLLLAGAAPSRAADYPVPVQGDAVLKPFVFASGESLPEL